MVWLSQAFASHQDLEDILETYFAQLDRTCSRLRALDEHVSQTEDFVNIDLARGCRGALLLRGCTADVAEMARRIRSATC